MLELLRIVAKNRRLATFLGIAGFVTVLGIVCLALGVETVQRQPWWFWRLQTKNVLLPGLGVVSGVGALLVLANARWCSGSTRHLAWNTAMAFLAGYVLQQGFALAEGRGAAAMRSRIQFSGHKEFAFTATGNQRAEEVLRNYEDLVRDRSQIFARSKPPGQLLYYMAMSRVAQAVMPHLWNPPKPAELRPATWHLMNFAVLFFPLFACLVLVPLAFLGRWLLPPSQAHWPLLLYVVTAPAVLVTLHLDQVLYPFLVASLWALAVGAARARGAIAWWVWSAAGATAWLALFVSFSLLPAIPLAAFLALAASKQQGGARRAFAGLVLAAGTFLVFAVLFRMAANYDLRIAYERVLLNHRAGKRWDDAHRLSAGLCTLSEFGYWIGAPFVALFVWESLATLRSTWRRRDASGAGAWMTLAVLLVTAFLGTTYAEVARLWIFFVPVVALFAAHRLSMLVRPTPALAPWALGSCLLLQLFWTLALKVWQDF